MDVLKKVFRATTNNANASNSSSAQQQQPTHHPNQPQQITSAGYDLSGVDFEPINPSAASAIPIQPRALPNNNHQMAISPSSSRSPDARIIASAAITSPSDGSRENVSASDAVAVNRPISDDVIDPNFKFPPNKPALIRLVPFNPHFPVIEKELIDGQIIGIGRYQRHQQVEDPHGEGIYYRSTVVSRRHGQLALRSGEVYITDIKSLGGTFVNSVRLSGAGKESRPCKVMHGDIIQFGVDYRPDSRTGQVRNKDRCVEVRIEFPKYAKKKKIPKPPRWKPAAHTHTECCICLSALYEKQALFIAPCSHTFHYRCIAPLLRSHGFSCPLCRQQSDLHASLFSLDESEEEEEEEEVVIVEKQDAAEVKRNVSPMNGGPKPAAVPSPPSLQQQRIMPIIHPISFDDDDDGDEEDDDDRFMIRAETFASDESVNKNNGGGNNEVASLTQPSQQQQTAAASSSSPSRIAGMAAQSFTCQNLGVASELAINSDNHVIKKRDQLTALNTRDLRQPQEIPAQSQRQVGKVANTPLSAAETFINFGRVADDDGPTPQGAAFESPTLARGGTADSAHRTIREHHDTEPVNAAIVSHPPPLLVPVSQTTAYFTATKEPAENTSISVDLNQCFSEAFYPNLNGTNRGGSKDGNQPRV